MQKPYKSLQDVYLAESFAKAVPLLPRQTILGEAEADVASDPAIPTAQTAPSSGLDNIQPSSNITNKEPVKKQLKKRDRKSKESIECRDKPNIEIKDSDEFKQIKDSPALNKQWSAYQRQLFPVKKTGTGRGEFSVASFVSGLQPSLAIADREIRCLLDDCVQGQSESFDVSVPPDTEEYMNTRKLKFEVKELEADGSSVRIGAEGQKATTMIIGGVIKLIERLENSYHSLNREERLKVDDLLRKQLGLTREGPPAKPSNETKKNLAKYGKDRHMYELGQGWNLGGYISAIFQSDEQDQEGRTIRELPSTLIKKEGTMIPSRYSKSPLRARYFLRTLQEVFNAIEEIARSASELSISNNSKSQELRNIVRRLYLPEIPDENTRKKEEEFLDDLVDTIDRKLTRRKITASGAGYLTAKDFFSSVNNLKLLSSLRAVQNMFNNAEIIRNLFPKDITGLFLVSDAQFSYFPQNTISDYIEIDQISNGGVKIAVKNQQQANDNI